MSTDALTPTSYLVLGCLESAGPSTPYDLKQLVAVGIGNFWSFPHSQLYSEPARLAGLGLVSERREQAGRRRRVFAITDTGRAALQAWLADPATEPPEIRDIGLLKLFFGAAADPADVIALAATQRDAHLERLAGYRALADDAGTLVDTDPAVRTLRLGIAYETAASEFWAAVADQPPTPPT